MKFFSVNSVTLHYQQEGLAEGIPLVFINPLGSDLRIWNDVVSHLKHHFSLIRFDKRGHGLSDAPPDPYTMRELSGDVNGLLDHLGIERAVLVGMSVGGLIALQYALDFSGRIMALVLCSTAAKIGSATYWDDRINTLRQFGMEYLADTILARWFAPKFIQQNPGPFRGFYNMLTRMPLDGYIGMCAALRDTDLQNKLGEINIPTLVLRGTEDVAGSSTRIRRKSTQCAPQTDRRSRTYSIG
jgi:3-oxoadipate enol-lactonase